MAAQLAMSCDIHQPEECPDFIVGYFQSTRDFGLRIHDGGTSMILIDFCPWCRTQLRPDSRSQLVRAGRLTAEALPEGVRPRGKGGSAMPGRRIEV